jgi:hypothetical protein
MKIKGWAWWLMPVIPASWEERKEDRSLKLALAKFLRAPTCQTKKKCWWVRLK